ncbi:MAG: SDR family NAD(P)-dependent oxidoreductase [Pelovirga sp.]
MNVLITGATSGIGHQLARDYQAAGHQVWAVGRNASVLAALQAEGIHTGQVDLTDRQQTLNWFSHLDTIDLAILSAGNCEYMDLPVFDSALLARVMRANVETMGHTIEGVLPALRRSAAPQLVGIGSSAAYLPLPRAEAYGASKAAVAYLLETLRITLAAEGIRVSLVAPGFVETPLTGKNDFPMPCLVSVSDASAVIRRGIAAAAAEIHFPRRFTLSLKALSLLPRGLWLKLAQRMIRS